MDRSTLLIVNNTELGVARFGLLYFRDVNRIISFVLLHAKRQSLPSSHEACV